MEKIPQSVSVGQLEKHLARCKVDIGSWKKGETKTFDELVADVRSGAAEIVMYRQGESDILIERHITSAVIDIICLWGGTSLLKLQESSRTMGVFPKEPRTAHSVSGKVLPKEMPINAALRCLQQKFGFSIEIQLAKKRGGESPLDAIRRHQRKFPASASCCVLTNVCMYQLPDPDPESFPGLPTLRDMYLFICSVPESLSKPESFTRRFGDKIITYEWRPFEKDKGKYIFEPQVY